MTSDDKLPVKVLPGISWNNEDKRRNVNVEKTGFYPVKYATRYWKG